MPSSKRPIASAFQSALMRTASGSAASLRLCPRIASATGPQVRPLIAGPAAVSQLR